MPETTAGRALDERVAIEVMGWKRGTLYGNGNGEWIVPGAEKRGIPMTWDRTPRYSTDIAAAFLVVGKLRTNDGGDYEQYWTLIDLCDLGWMARLWCVPNQSDEPAMLAQGSGLELPFAICECALRAVAAPPPAEEPR